MHYLCIDIGGTAIKYGIAGQNGTLLLRGEMPNEIRKKGVKHFIDHIIRFTELCRQGYNLLGIAVSTAGVVEPESGIVLDHSGIFPPNTALRELLEQGCGLPCTVANDANAAALGEYWLGAGRGAKSLYCITVGTGIGGGAVLNGELIYGATFCAGEIEHQNVGIEGAWKRTAPTWALISSMAKAKGIPEEKLNGKKIFAMAQAGDEDAKAAIAKQMDSLAAGIANICYVLIRNGSL